VGKDRRYAMDGGLPFGGCRARGVIGRSGVGTELPQVGREIWHAGPFKSSERVTTDYDKSSEIEEDTDSRSERTLISRCN